MELKSNGYSHGRAAEAARHLAFTWLTDPRWTGVERRYLSEDVVRLRGSFEIEYTFAERGARRLWHLLNVEESVRALGAVSGEQALQQVRAGIKAIYLSGCHVAADSKLLGNLHPDLGLYPRNSVPSLVRSVNQTLLRADQVTHSEGDNSTYWMAPIVADADAGDGGVLNAFEMMKAMIEAGAAGVHFEDQLAAEKKSGHLGGKVLVPTSQFIETLQAARLATDVMGVPTIIIARTDANAADLLVSDVDERDRQFFTGERTPEGFFRTRPGLDQAIARGLAYAPHADLLWCETLKPDLEEARVFADAIREQHPDKMLAYNCSPSFNWRRHLDDHTIGRFQRELEAMGYTFQFVTLAGFHALNYSMFTLAEDYARRDMLAYADLQCAEFATETVGYTATRHQHEVGTAYHDQLRNAVTGGVSGVSGMSASTDSQQF